MKAVVVDASVWVAAQDATDPSCQQSRAFLSHAVSRGVVIHVPSLAKLEISCALARKLRDTADGTRLANDILHAASATEHSLTTTLMAKALSIGTANFLRGADAIYSALAETHQCDLVSWDKEHILRAQAWKPDDWQAANP